MESLPVLPTKKIFNGKKLLAYAGRTICYPTFDQAQKAFDDLIKRGYRNIKIKQGMTSNWHIMVS